MKPQKVLDNKKYKVVDELKEGLKKGSKLSIISAYFTIYAYAELKRVYDLEVFTAQTAHWRLYISDAILAVSQP